MKCRKCGHDEFNGHQIMRADIVVDEHGGFLRNHNEGLENHIYDSEKPYGPFCCLKCGAEYDELNESMAERTEKDKAIAGAMVRAMFRGLERD